MTRKPPTGTHASNVISLTRFRRDVPARPIRQVEGYWSALRTDGQLPKRIDVSPQGLETVLDYVFVLERIASGMARFRIAGSHVTALAGMEVRGMPISALFRLPARPGLTTALESCLGLPAAVEAPLTARPAGFGRALNGSMLFLPMTGPDGAVDRVLGALVIEGAPRAAAYRFGLGKYRIKPVDGTPLPERDISSTDMSETGDGPVRRALELVHSSD